MSKGDQKSNTAHYENAPRNEDRWAHPTRTQKLKNYLKRFWWIYLIIAVLLTLLIILLLLYVAFPRIAQDGINKANVNVISQEVTNPRPNAVHLNLVSESNNTTPFHPTLDSFVAAVYLPEAGPDNPFSYVTIPKLHATKVARLEVDQDLVIANMQQFTNYNKRSLNSEAYQISFKGQTRLREGKLPAVHINYEKTVTLKGLNSFNGFKLQNFTLLSKALPDGTNVEAKVLIPNPTNMIIHLGNVTLNLETDGQLVGSAQYTNLVLSPGNNEVAMTSATDQTVVLALVKSKYRDGILPVNITGNSTIYNGQHLTYFEDAFKDTVISTTFNITQALAQIGIPLSFVTGGGGSSSSSSSVAGFVLPTSSSQPLFGGDSSTSSAVFVGFPTSSSAALFGGVSSSSSSAGLVGFPTATTTSAPSGGLFALSSPLLLDR